MNGSAAALDLKSRNEALLARARCALEEFALISAKVSDSLAHSRRLLEELGSRDGVNAGLERFRNRRFRH